MYFPLSGSKFITDGCIQFYLTEINMPNMIYWNVLVAISKDLHFSLFVTTVKSTW